MASVLQVATIKDQGGNANAIEIANSSANVTINNLAGGAIGSAVTGVMNFIHQETASSHQTAWTVDNIFSSTYENYMVFLNIEATGDGESVKMRLLDNSGNQLNGAYYNAASSGWRSTNNSIDHHYEGGNEWDLARYLGFGGGEAYNGTLTFSGINTISRCIAYRQSAQLRPTTEEVTHLHGAGQYGSGAANPPTQQEQTVRGLRLFLSANQIQSGSKISVYGIR